MIAGQRLIDVGAIRSWDGPPLIAFVGVSTAASRIHEAFPAWASVLGVPWVLRGVDLPQDSAPDVYRELVEAVAENHSVAGAVITSHKLRLYRASAYLFDDTDLLTALSREVNSLSAGGGKLRGFARDPLALSATLDRLPSEPGAVDHPDHNRRGVLCLGAGGAATALLLALMLDVRASVRRGRPIPASRRPERLVFTDVDAGALRALRDVAEQCGLPAPAVELRHTEAGAAADLEDLLYSLPPHSLVVNATGRGKDRPGSPLPSPMSLPRSALAWDFNYRGDLAFLRQAREVGATVVDGWEYFVAGWGSALAAIADRPSYRRALCRARRYGRRTARRDTTSTIDGKEAPPLNRVTSRTRPGATSWWSDAVGYQVYLPSFQDSDGDGWGDLPGLTARLDYQLDLGVNLIWITPFYPSPMHDHGYDVADYCAVDSRYGSLTDLDVLLDSAHARGIRVVADLVVNHTSSQHPWFLDARTTRDADHRDYYIWRDPSAGGGPPNNWLSHFGGPAWSLDPVTGQYYLHLFTPEQPDLNWANPAVAAEVDAILRFWLDRGLDGFRIDTAHYLTKHASLPDNPLLDEDRVPRIGGVAQDWLAQDHRYDIEQPEAMDIHRRWRRIADQYDALLLGEVYILDPDRLARYVHDDGLHTAFWFGLVESDGDPVEVNAMLRAASAASPHLSWVQSSHDRHRAVTRYGARLASSAEGQRRALAITTLTMALPGIPFIYYGEELGLPDAAIPPDRRQDPLARANGAAGRDGARTPMPWTPEPNLGFTTADQAWSPLGNRQPRNTLAVQQADQASSWAAYRRLLHCRGRIVSSRAENLEWFSEGNGVIAYRSGDVAVVANLSDGPEPPPLDLAGWTCIFDTDEPHVLEPPMAQRPDQKLRSSRALILTR